MMTKEIFFIFFLLFFFISIVFTVGDHGIGHPKYEFSFSPPFEVNDLKSIPGWNFSGNSREITKDYIRLTRDIKNSNARLSNPKPYTDNTLELTLEYRIHSSNNIGADGMALWLSEEPIYLSGEAFGAPTQWKGLAIVFDTYDNNGEDPHPYIMLHYNDGSENFDFDHDGSSTFIDGCYSSYRNADRSFIHLFLENGVVGLYIDPEGDGIWEKCIEPVRLQMPESFYFCFSAATGGFADNHDIISFEVQSMEARSIEIYKPPQDLINKDKQNIQDIPIFIRDPGDCSIVSECINLNIFDEVIEDFQSINELIGHELVKIQNAIEESIKQINNDIVPVSSDISIRRNEIQTMRYKFEQEIKDIITFKEFITTNNGNEETKKEEMLRIRESITQAQRTITGIISEQKNLAVLLDLQIEATKYSSTNTWLIIAFILGLIQLIIVILNFFKREKQRYL